MGSVQVGCAIDNCIPTNVMVTDALILGQTMPQSQGWWEFIRKLESITANEGKFLNISP